MPDDLFMVRMRLDPLRLAQLQHRRGLSAHVGDIGYLAHCALGEVFTTQQPHVFAIEREHTHGVDILAYSAHGAESLKVHADTYADPAAHGVLDWSEFASKSMPTIWKSGQRLGFRTRVCPIQRMAKADANHRAGAEVDVFLAEAWRKGADIRLEREAVYRDWLAGNFERHGAHLVQSRLTSFRRTRLVRRTHGIERLAHCSERPDAIFEGTCEVRDPLGFAALMARGIGRHRGFGFGMVLLRPLGSAC